MSNLKFKFKFSILPNQQMATSETPGTVTEGEHPKDENGRYTFSIQFVFASKYTFKSYDFPKVFMFFFKFFKFSITFSSKKQQADSDEHQSLLALQEEGQAHGSHLPLWYNFFSDKFDENSYQNLTYRCNC